LSGKKILGTRIEQGRQDSVTAKRWKPLAFASAFDIPDTFVVSAVCTVEGGAGGAGCACTCVGLEGCAGLTPGLGAKL
jgi:hypothetical protein